MRKIKAISFTPIYFAVCVKHVGLSLSLCTIELEIIGRMDGRSLLFIGWTSKFKHDLDLFWVHIRKDDKWCLK